MWSDTVLGIIHAFSGHNPDNPIVAHDIRENINPEVTGAPSITPTANDCMVVTMFTTGVGLPDLTDHQIPLMSGEEVANSPSSLTRKSTSSYGGAEGSYTGMIISVGVQNYAVPTGDSSVFISPSLYPNLGAIIAIQPQATGPDYSAEFTITVKDSLANTSTLSTPGPWLVASNEPTIAIDDSGVGIIPRGANYNGTMLAIPGSQTPVPPVLWEVAPTSDNPNLLPSGLILASGDGDIATISGIYSGSPLSGYLIRVVAVDSVGNTGVALVPLSTVSGITITTPSLPNAIVGVGYSFQMMEAGGVGPFTWSWDQSNPYHGLSLSSGGLISGTPLVVFSTPILFTVTDSLGNQASATLTLTSQASGLTITTSSLTPITPGVPYYSTQLAASGSSFFPYVWSVVQGTLPTGITLSTSSGNGTNGILQGTSYQEGYRQNITFRVTDNSGAYAQATFLVSVIAGEIVISGIDYSNGLSLGILGYNAVCNPGTAGHTDTISPRINLSYYVVLTGAISTDPSQITVTVTSNDNLDGVFSGTVESLQGGIALIRLSHDSQTLTSFSNTVPGTYSVTVSILDSGVPVSGVFSFVVYGENTGLYGLFSAAALSINSTPILPIFEGSTGSSSLSNYSGSTSWVFQTYNGVNVDPATAGSEMFQINAGDNNWQGLVDVEYTPSGPSTFGFRYNGATIPANVDASLITLEAGDIAWSGSVAGNPHALDIYGPSGVLNLGSGLLSGGVGNKFYLTYAIRPGIGSFNPQTVVGDGLPHVFQILLDRPFPPNQWGYDFNSSNSIGTPTVSLGSTPASQVVPVYNSDHYLIGWNATITVPVQGPGGSQKPLKITCSGSLQYLTGNVITNDHNVHYFSNTLVGQVNITANQASPTVLSATFPGVSNPLTFNTNYTMEVVVSSPLSDSLTCNFLAQNVSNGVHKSLGAGSLVSSYQSGGLYYKVFHLSVNSNNLYAGGTNLGAQATDSVNGLSSPVFYDSTDWTVVSGVYKPTAFTDVGQLPTQNPSYAYDNDLNSYAKFYGTYNSSDDLPLADNGVYSGFTNSVVLDQASPININLSVAINMSAIVRVFVNLGNERLHVFEYTQNLSRQTISYNIPSGSRLSDVTVGVLASGESSNQDTAIAQVYDINIQVNG